MNIFKKILRVFFNEDTIRKIKSVRHKLIYKKIFDRIEKKYNQSLVYLAQRELEDKFFQVNPSEVKNILGEKKIRVFDIGARGGLEKEFENYRDLLDITLVEPDPKEAEVLEKEGYNVVKCLLGEKQGQRKLNIGKRAGTSSYLQPDGGFLEFYTSGDSDRFEIVDEVELPVDTLENILNESNKEIDYLKLDTQGSEKDILEGLGQHRPIFIKSEISFVPLYGGSTIFFELGDMLYKRGYILFHMTHYARSAPSKYKSKSAFDQTVIPTHGDAWFCPDWTRDEGRAIIKGREAQYEALSSVFAMKDIHQYANNYKNNL